MDKIASGQFDTDQNECYGSTTIIIEPRAFTGQCLAAWLQHSEYRARVCAVTTPEAASDQNGGDTSLLVWCIGALPASSEIVVSGVQQLRACFPTTPLALLADREEPADIRAAIRLGVRGYVPTSYDRCEALEVLKFVRAGGTYVPASALVDGHEKRNRKDGVSIQSNQGQIEDQACPFDRLTPREVDVVKRIRHGKPNKVIAYELDISESTVKVFVHRILNKLGAVNRTEVAYLAQQYLP